MNSLFKVCILLITLFFFAFCKKDKNVQSQTPTNCHGCQDCPTSNSYLPSDISNLKFKVGSYWIYEDSVSSHIDSNSIYETPLNGIYTTVICNLGPELYVFHLESYNNPQSNGNDYALYGNSLYRSYGAPPSNLSDNLYTDVNAKDTIHIKIDSILISNIYYKKVQKFTNPSDWNEGNLKTVYYTNSSFGLLRKDVFNSNGTLASKKILIRSHIVK